MGLETLRRAELGTLALGLITGVLVAVFHTVSFGAGIVAGAVWSAANVWALSGLLRQEIRRRRGEASRRTWVIWGIVKFPLLYGGGYLLLARTPFPPESLLIGMAVLFVIWTAEAAWRSFGVAAGVAAGTAGKPEGKQGTT